MILDDGGHEGSLIRSLQPVASGMNGPLSLRIDIAGAKASTSAAISRSFRSQARAANQPRVGRRMVAISVRSGAMLSALKAVAKVERAELVLAGSDHSVTTTHDDEAAPPGSAERGTQRA